CAPAPERSAAEGQAAPAPIPQSVLRILIRNQPQTLTTRVSIGSGRLAQALFNAGLSELDLHDAPHPYLAQDLPRLGTDSWQVLADGRMETIYRLRPGLVWHDGAP